MSLREKRPGYWEVRVYAGTDPVSGKRRSVARGVRGTKRDAKRLEAALLHEVAERPVTETEGTLLFACNQVIDHLEQIGRSPTTIDSYRQLADGRIAERIGAIRLCDLTTRDIDGFYASMSAEGVSPSRVEKYHRFLHMVLNRAMKWDWVARNVVANSQRPEVHRDPVDPPSVDAVRLILDAARRGRNADMGTALAMLSALGCRRGELCGLQWGDIDLETGDVQIRRAVVKPNRAPLMVKTPKSGRSRTVRIGPKALGELAAYRFVVEQRMALGGMTVAPEAFVFSADLPGREPWHPVRISHAFDALRKRLGVDCRLHDLRHWNVSVLLDQGEAITVASARAGHSHAATTGRIYAHRMPKADDRAAAIIDQALYGED